MTHPSPMHPHDQGLPQPVVRQRRRARRLAHGLLLIAVGTAVLGWPLFGSTVASALKVREQSPYWAIAAYGLLVVSSVTLILGLWYLLVAQVDRVARIVGDEQADEVPAEGVAAGALRCANCGWPRDGADRFCRHCGKAVGVEAGRASAEAGGRVSVSGGDGQGQLR